MDEQERTEAESNEAQSNSNHGTQKVVEEGGYYYYYDEGTNNNKSVKQADNYTADQDDRSKVIIGEINDKSGWFGNKQGGAENDFCVSGKKPDVEFAAERKFSSGKRSCDVQERLASSSNGNKVAESRVFTAQSNPDFPSRREILDARRKKKTISCREGEKWVDRIENWTSIADFDNMETPLDRKIGEVVTQDSVTRFLFLEYLEMDLYTNRRTLKSAGSAAQAIVEKLRLPEVEIKGSKRTSFLPVDADTAVDMAKRWRKIRHEIRRSHDHQLELSRRRVSSRAGLLIVPDS